jgi:hypothetical protein
MNTAAEQMIHIEIPSRDVGRSQAIRAGGTWWIWTQLTPQGRLSTEWSEYRTILPFHNFLVSGEVRNPCLRKLPDLRRGLQGVTYIVLIGHVRMRLQSLMRWHPRALREMHPRPWPTTPTRLCPPCLIVCPNFPMFHAQEWECSETTR